MKAGIDDKAKPRKKLAGRPAFHIKRTRARFSRPRVQQKIHTADELLAVSEEGDGKAFRIDLDDLGGEVCLLDWGEDHADVVAAINQPRGAQHLQLMQGRISVLLAEETVSMRQSRSRSVSFRSKVAKAALICGGAAPD